MVGSVPSIPNVQADVVVAKPGVPAVAAQALNTLIAAWRVRRERRTLMSLDERMLKDIGLNAGDVERETSRSILDLPRRRDKY